MLNFIGFRTDTNDYFSLSGIREDRQRKHHPFVVFAKEGITICYSAEDLLATYENDVDVIAQWGGEWRSDFFKFTVGDLRKYVIANPKQSYHRV